MELRTEFDHPVHDLIRRRWSPRAFADRPIEPEKLCSLLEAARWAASSYNEQPWSFLVATRDQTDVFEKMVGCLVEGNVPWASKAPVLLLSVAKLSFHRNDKPNRHALHDVGLAVGNFCLEATAQDLFVHQMAGFHVDKAREAFGIPDECEPVAMIAVGYLEHPGDSPDGSPPHETPPRSRKPLGDFVYTGTWGKVASFVRDTP